MTYSHVGVVGLATIKFTPIMKAGYGGIIASYRLKVCMQNAQVVRGSSMPHFSAAQSSLRQVPLHPVLTPTYSLLFLPKNFTNLHTQHLTINVRHIYFITGRRDLLGFEAKRSGPSTSRSRFCW